MNIYTVRLITFSPTHTSKQVGEAIVRGTGISDVARTDLTFHPVGKLEIPENTLTVITVPVYGGKVAPPALERMKDVHASGAPAVLVAVYGNRAYEKALVELDAFASDRGFKVIAGATFVGEHSYSTQQNPIAAGRPDADDLQFAETFGAKIRTKIEAAADMDKLYAVDVNRIQRPHQAFFRYSVFAEGGETTQKRSSYAAHSGCRHRTLQPLRILREALSGRRHRERR